MVALLKSQSLMKLGFLGATYVEFRHVDADEPLKDQGHHASLRFVMDKKHWKDMRHPEIITITVEHGDTLNEGD